MRRPPDLQQLRYFGVPIPSIIWGVPCISMPVRSGHGTRRLCRTRHLHCTGPCQIAGPGRSAAHPGHRKCAEGPGRTTQTRGPSREIAGHRGGRRGIRGRRADAAGASPTAHLRRVVQHAGASVSVWMDGASAIKCPLAFESPPLNSNSYFKSDSHDRIVASSYARAL